jgi:predicted metal-dependent hydrolase
MTAVAPIDRLLWVDIHRALRDWCHLWGIEEMAPEISVEFSSRMTRSLGRCYADRKLIRIAQFVREESDALVQEVLCHEAAHIAAHHLYGSSIRPHGPEWKSLMLKAGYPPSVRYRRASLIVPPARVPKRGGIGSTLRNLRQQILRRLARI